MILSENCVKYLFGLKSTQTSLGEVVIIPIPVVKTVAVTSYQLVVGNSQVLEKPECCPCDESRGLELRVHYPEVEPLPEMLDAHEVDL